MTAASHAASIRGGGTLDDLKPPVLGIILDVDGVLWKESQPIGDLHAIFEALRQRELAVTIATNNAMRTVEEYVDQFRAFGVSLEPRQIVTSGTATAETLAARFPERGPVFVLGEHGLRHALRQYGFEVVVDPLTPREFVAVVAGIDRDLSYAKLQQAATLIRAGAPYFGTNPDPTFPTPQGLVPGAGAILAALDAATGSRPIIVGKPSQLLFETAARRMELEPDRVLVVGDRLETDIAGGQAFGARTAVVLSGVSSAQQAAVWRPAPTLIAPDLSALLAV